MTALQLDLLDLLTVDDAPVPASSVALDVAHAGRHALWSWMLTWVLGERRAAFLGNRYGGGGDCDVCGWWEYDRKGVTLARDGGWRELTETRFSWSAILADLDRRAAARPDLVAEAIALNVSGWNPRAAGLADELWSTS